MAESTGSISLTSLADQSSDNDLEPHAQLETPAPALGRVDGGLSAWMLLCAAFIFEAVLWGFPLSFGIFQSYYSTLPQFKDNSYITYVGIIATGITYMGAPLMVPLVKRYPKYQRAMIWLGWVLCIFGLVCGSFADSVGGLIATQGVLYGVGYLIIFYPIISIMNEWWVMRRGFAWGIMAGASGASGVVYPFIIESLLDKYGYKTTLRSLAVATAILTGPLLPVIKPRLPPSSSVAAAPTDWSFLRKGSFWFYAISTVIQSLGFYLPSLYLPSYAATLGLSSKIGALLVALLSATQMLGQFTYGWLSDGRLPLNSLLISIGIGAAASSFALWGLAKSIAPLIMFSLLFGFFGYAYLAMRVRMGTAVDPEHNAAMATFCIFSFIQGIGNILAAPISEALLVPAVDLQDYGSLRYKPLIVFTGCSMAVSAASIAIASFMKKARVI